MNSISPFVNNAMNIAIQVFKNGVQQISQWANYSVSLIQLIPQQMQQNRNVAIAVIATANTTFFFAIHFIINRLDKRLENQAMPLNAEQRTIKHILLNGVILGGSIFSANLLLSKVTHYPLNKSLLATIASAAIVSRILLNQVQKYLARNEKPVGQEEEITLIASPQTEVQSQAKKTKLHSSQKVEEGKESEKTEKAEEKPVVEDQKPAKLDAIDEEPVEDETLKQAKETEEKPVDENLLNDLNDKEQVIEGQQEHVGEADEELLEENSLSPEQLAIKKQIAEEAEIKFNAREQEKAAKKDQLNKEFLEEIADEQALLSESEEDSDVSSEFGDNQSEEDELFLEEDKDISEWGIFDVENHLFTDQNQVEDQAKPSLVVVTEDLGKEEESEKIQQPSHQLVVVKPKAPVIATSKDDKSDPDLVQKMYAEFLKKNPPLYRTDLSPFTTELLKKKKKEEKSSVTPYQKATGSGIYPGTLMGFARGWKHLPPSNPFQTHILPFAILGMRLSPFATPFWQEKKTSASNNIITKE